MSRVNLGLHQSDASVLWDLGPHDFSILRYWLGRCAGGGLGDDSSLRLSGHPDVAFVNMRVRERHDRAPRAVLALSEQAAPDDDHRVVEDGRVRRHEPRAGQDLRLGRIARRSESFGEYRLTYRTGDIVSPRIEATEPLALEMSRLLRCDPRWDASCARHRRSGSTSSARSRRSRSRSRQGAGPS